jgi:hypothetical protein
MSNYRHAASKRKNVAINIVNLNVAEPFVDTSSRRTQNRNSQFFTHGLTSLQIFPPNQLDPQALTAAQACRAESVFCSPVVRTACIEGIARDATS